MPSLTEDRDFSDEGEDCPEMPRKTRSKAESAAPKIADAAAIRTGEKRIVIVEDSMLASSGGDSHPDVVQLQHPRTKQAASFMFNSDNSEIREILTFKEENRSWFIDECIESNGKVFMASPFDPCLLVLPYLMSVERNVPLNQLLVDRNFPEISRLNSNSDLKRKIEKIADSIGSKDLDVWKYNENKTLEFLSEKVNRLSKALISKGLDVRGGASSGSYVKSLNEKIDKVGYLRFAHGILSDYLDESLAEKLREFLKIPTEEKNVKGSNKRESQNALQSKNKKPRHSQSDGPDEDYSTNYQKVEKKEINLSAKQKALAKNASGTKSIMSFFSKKN